MANYDLIVVGGGPGGYVAAIYGAQNGLKTALVERDNLGGTCLNWGCIPTKALARNAEVLRTVNEAAEYGIALDTKSIKANYAAAQERSREVSAKLVRGIQGLMRKNKVEVIKGEGVLVSGTQVKVGDTTYSAKNIILATGAHPFKIPTIDYSNKNVMTSRQALELKDAKPGDKFVVIGAGAIGMEFASIWASYGVDVTVIEMLPRILPNEDADISAEVEKAFNKRGIKTMPGTKVVHVVAEGNDITVIVEKDGKRQTLKCCKLLVSAGVRANVSDIGLEAAGVKLTERGLIQVDENLRTTCPTVYAIGDITGKLALAHVASAQALAAVHAIVGKPVKQFNYMDMPRCTYTFPEVASCGLTEAQAKDKGFDVKVGMFPLVANGKSLAMNESTGFVKIVADKEYNQILGVHLVGAHVTELINAPASYIDLEITADDIAQVVHPHPSVSEAIMEAAHAVCGHAIHI